MDTYQINKKGQINLPKDLVNQMDLRKVYFSIVNERQFKISKTKTSLIHGIEVTRNVTAVGQLTIPEQFRNYFKIDENTNLTIDLVFEQKIIFNVENKTTIKSFNELVDYCKNDLKINNTINDSIIKNAILGYEDDLQLIKNKILEYTNLANQFFYPEGFTNLEDALLFSLFIGVFISELGNKDVKIQQCDIIGEQLFFNIENKRVLKFNNINVDDLTNTIELLTKDNLFYRNKINILEGVQRLVMATLPPLSHIPILTIRYRTDNREIYNLDLLKNIKSINDKCEEIIKDCIENNLNIIVLGKTATGKTSIIESMINHLSGEDERICVLEDVEEIKINKNSGNLFRFNKSFMETNMETNYINKMLKNLDINRYIISDVNNDLSAKLFLDLSENSNCIIGEMHSGLENFIDRFALLCDNSNSKKEINSKDSSYRKQIIENVDIIIEVGFDENRNRIVKGVYALSKGESKKEYDITPIIYYDIELKKWIKNEDSFSSILDGKFKNKGYIDFIKKYFNKKK